LIILSRWNINFRGDHKKAEFVNNTVIVLIFLITVINIMISAFGPTPEEELPFTISKENKTMSA